MWAIAIDGVAWSICMSLCLLVTFVSSAKMAEPIEILGLTQVGPRNHVLNGGQGQTNPFAIMRGE